MEPMTITILGVEYKITCAPEEEDALRRSASLLDSRLHTMRLNGRMSVEQAAIMTGLNLANELLRSETTLNTVRFEWLERIDELSRKLDQAIGTKKP